jgi:hypothetical protein
MNWVPHVSPLLRDVGSSKTHVGTATLGCPAGQSPGGARSVSKAVALLLPRSLRQAGGLSFCQSMLRNYCGKRASMMRSGL